MADKIFPKSNLPIRKTVDFLPQIFRTETNEKFLGAIVDPLIQPGVLEKITGYIGRRYGKTYNGEDIYLDSDETLRSRYQLEPAVVVKNDKIENLYDYIDFKNQLKFFGNDLESDNKITDQQHYTWNPPICWDKFVNFREYYWEPLGPPSVDVLGNYIGVTSTYRVSLGFGSTYIFSPDGFTNNPRITLYRGQTYKFRINSPGHPFNIRSNIDTGKLNYNPNSLYNQGEFVVYNNKIWRAKKEVQPGGPTVLDENSLDWEISDNSTINSVLNYNDGVTNNGIEQGELIFEVPFDAPGILFYQSTIDPDRFGQFIIESIESNTKIDIEKEILGKETYVSSNGVEFTNGLIVNFKGQVTPAQYSSDSWLVEGVGRSINLTKFSDLISPDVNTEVTDILFDDEGFDTRPFDDAANYPFNKDYIVISRDSKDKNPWSRNNRWFHRSVLEFSYQSKGRSFDANENLRAKRPIIEFSADLQLYNHGSVLKESVDFVDDFTTDIFSTIEGSAGYIIEGESLFNGSRVLFTADTDRLVRNKIFTVRIITHQGRRQLHLEEDENSFPSIGDCVIVKKGQLARIGGNKGLMYHFNGVTWVRSQEKISVNQPPLFDVFDKNGISFSDSETYPGSSFKGTKIVSYKPGNSIKDSELKFSISYLNIDNIGDIEFDWNWEKESFDYLVESQNQVKLISTGFYKFNNEKDLQNGWILLDNTFIQPIIDSQNIVDDTSEVIFETVDWSLLEEDHRIRFYLNGEMLTPLSEYFPYSRNSNKFTFNKKLKKNSTLSLKIITKISPDKGYYQLPVGLEKNPLNDSLSSFTYGQAFDHLKSSLEFDNDIYKNVTSVNSIINLRDLNGYQNKATRFLKHAGLFPISSFLLCDKQFNLIKSLQYAKKSYSTFKNDFIIRSGEINFNDNIVDIVDEIILSLSTTKTSSSPFFGSDMIGSGAYSSIEYIVDDTEIKTFSLSKKFNLDEPSDIAVYVYLNGKQLIHGEQYEFNPIFGFISVKIDLQENDFLQIREYVSTSINFIPATPTKLGLWKKFKPVKFIDNTYIEPTEVIQGHDGSLTIAFGDYRDDLLLELEYRIYNNIKQQYDESIFDFDEVIGTYYHDGDFKKSHVDKIISKEFLKWISNSNIGYTLNEYFDSENSFTYTYSNMTDKEETTNLPGWWRGVYKWYYRTDRPHRCPWEMLGFSEKPDWWEKEYGPAPYTKGNLILWEDIKNGIIRNGPRAGTYKQYKHDSILDHIPVDGDGNLLSPLDSNLAYNFSLINNTGSFIFGDNAPVENAWRINSEWPFALVISMCLLKPTKFINLCFDKNKNTNNRLGQFINKDTEKYTTVQDFEISTDLVGSSGLVNYLRDYVRFLGLSQQDLNNKILSLKVYLTSRLSGFVDKQQQKYLLDTKSAKSTSSTIFIPPENYDIVFNVSVPVRSIVYSGVIIEKTNKGWSVQGYDSIEPYFNYFEAVPNQKDPIISVGGVSAAFSKWEPNKTYSNGEIVEIGNFFYRSLKTHQSGEDFDNTFWARLPKLPIVGAVTAANRKNFNKLIVKKISYGEELFSIQHVVDFLLGYSEYLESEGILFGDYDAELKESKNWVTSAKEFMFWTRHNWNEGSLISLSPLAERIKILNAVGVADNVLDSFYDYQIYKSDGKPLPPQFLNVKRDFQSTELSTTSTNDGIYLAKIFYVLKEHVVVFDDRTVFNDIIYDKPSGYRQERIKTQGFRTVDWDGDYTSPGFLFDNVDIKVWQPFVDYKLGDIVSYKSFNWTSQTNHRSSSIFEESKWSKLDSTPEKRLVPNFDYRINLFEDYFDVGSDGVGQAQRDLARHSVGYQPRDYLQNLAEDSVTQFELYRGFIRDKGTVSSLEKVFGKKSKKESLNFKINEEWAFRIGKFGGYNQNREFEISLNKSQFLLNPQPIQYLDSIPDFSEDRIYKITKQDFTILDGHSNLFLESYESEPILTVGYVRPDQVDLIVESRNDLFNLDIDQIQENRHIWITFDLVSWNVYRYNRSPVLFVVGIDRQDSEVIIFFNRPHTFKPDDLIGLRIENLRGFFEILRTGTDSVVLKIDESSKDPEFDESTLTPVWTLTQSRFVSYQSLDKETSALLPNRSKLWIDKNEKDLWEVIDKKNQYVPKNSAEYGVSDPVGAGTKVLYDDNNKLIISSIPGSGVILTYIERSDELSIRQILTPPQFLENSLNGSFGKEMAVSPDSRWLIVGSPQGFSPNNFKGDIEELLMNDPTRSFLAGEIVLYKGRLWRAKEDISAGDGSTNIDVYNDSWEIARIIPTESSGSTPGFEEQGFVSIYEFVNQQWIYRTGFVSPRPSVGEHFGSKIRIGKDQNNYYLFVSAPNSLSGVGRTYIFSYDDRGWYLLENENYRGEYNNNVNSFYPKGSIVYNNGLLFEAIEDTFGDGSSLSVDSNSWIIVDNISSQGYLPKSPAVELDGSTLYKGKINQDNLLEIIKEGDAYGSSLAISSDASILVVGSPFSDDQFFENYKGLWKHDKEYFHGDVVRFRDYYHQLITNDDLPVIGIEPIGLPWSNVGDSSKLPSGKVFVYQRVDNNYLLRQTISAETIQSLFELNKKLEISVGDEFGYAIDMDARGDVLIVSSPKADLNLKNQGSVYIFERSDTTVLQYNLVQVLESYDQYPNEYFGIDVCIGNNQQKIAVGSKNSPYRGTVIFDKGNTTFDDNTSRFIEELGFSGGVYIFEKKSGSYFLTEKLDTNLSPFESFGHSIFCTDSLVVVGSPNYIAPAPHGPLGFVTYEGERTGITRLFKKPLGTSSWNVISSQQPVVDINKIAGVSLYDSTTNIKITDLDIVDPAKYKILGIADQEIKFKTEYDPAIYNVGDIEVIVDPDLSWAEKHVGELWWDISKSKWLYYEQGDLNYRSNNWGKLAPGSSIAVCEWVETTLLPSEWAAIADTTEGLSFGISGQPLYPNDTIYTRKVILNTVTFEPTGTLYYYWVVNKSIKPNIKTRRLSAADVSTLISDPSLLGVPFIGISQNNSFLLFNVDRLIENENVLINIISKTDESRSNLVHNEYEILSEDELSSTLSDTLETKWLDSLVGFNEIGQQVPDPTLPEKQKYGISYRPRQGMFVDRVGILKDTIIKINSILDKEQFADTVDLSRFNSKEEIPDIKLNLYDISVDLLDDLEIIGVERVKNAIIKANIVNGTIDTIDIVDPGYGYKLAPPVNIDGNGTGAVAKSVIDNQGRIIKIDVISKGRKYTKVDATVRPFSVLVRFDKSQKNKWSIYQYNNQRKEFSRSRTQLFDTRLFWNYKDWWREGYDPTQSVIKEIVTYSDQDVVDLNDGDLVRIKEYGNGGWAVIRITKNDPLVNKFLIVGRENGTIELSDVLYKLDQLGVGYDRGRSFDTDLYDLENSKELRIILKSLKNDIFINEYQIEWSRLFFLSIRYVFKEQQYVDWAFKTSLIRIRHEVGSLEKRLNYKNDNLESYLEYLHEVKPYRTTVRDFYNAYQSSETSLNLLSDFDLPPVYSKTDGKIISVTEENSQIDEYPWKIWKENNTYSVKSIEIFDAGDDYTTVPEIKIIGNGVGATAKAFISGKKLVKIIVTDSGSGYKSAPEVFIVGGNGNSNRTAKATAVIGDSKVRTFNLSLKFDRFSKSGLFENFAKEETFTATGISSVFELKYPPTYDRNKIKVFKNSELVLKNEYSINFFKIYNGEYTVLKAKIVFKDVPKGPSVDSLADIITVSYEINEEIYNSIDRIEKFYTPLAGMKDRNINQLMTGIDFGGVKIQGSTFDVTGGWDALPWYADTWDSVEPKSEFYYAFTAAEYDAEKTYRPGSTVKVDKTIYKLQGDGLSEPTDIPGDSGSRWEKIQLESVELSFVPASGQEINIYIRKFNSDKEIRIDDPLFNESLIDSSLTINPNAKIQTFVGDGSSNSVTIPLSLTVDADDVLIFRSVDSDGSIEIVDSNIVDTNLSGGFLSTMAGAFSTATGINAEDISIDGGNFVSPIQIPAPEENIPGQVLDSVSIKVFDSQISGSAPLVSTIKVSNGSTQIYPLSVKILEKQSVIVYVNKIKQLIDIDYEINFINNTVNFINIPTDGSIVEIYAFGIGGVSILDYQEFVSDGETDLFLTGANYFETSSVIVTVDGILQDIPFANSQEYIDVSDKTIIKFGIKPERFSVIKILSFGLLPELGLQGINVVRVNQQEIIYDGSTRRFPLDKFVSLTRGSSLSSVVVEVNGNSLYGVDTILEIYNGTKNSFEIGKDPQEPAGVILPSNIKVFVNDQLLIFLRDYDYDGVSKIVTIFSNLLTEGDTIKIENDLNSKYFFIDNDIILNNDTSLSEGDIISVTWFSEYPSMGIVSDEYVGNKINYQLKTVPLSAAYVWVYKNGNRLIQDIDYRVEIPRGVVYLLIPAGFSDIIKIVQFGSKIYQLPVAYEIHKDVLNVYRYKRISLGNHTLSKDLNYYDKEIHLNDSEGMFEPDIRRNIPGVISINNEKIAYFKKDGNVLSQLRRGYFGSSIKEVHKVNSSVIDQGSDESIPYNELQIKDDFVSDGSTVLIGPLSYTPTKYSKNDWYKETIPEEYGPCYEIEVFAAGRRLFKDPTTIYDENLGQESPAADRLIEAEFSVNGNESFVRLTTPVPAGSRITVIKKIGNTWYDKGRNSASAGQSLRENQNSIAKFIAEKNTDLPE